jgi:hypothetical protein
VTGSGKTEVYLQAIARVRAEGRGALVLVPEIALTPQLASRFRARFGDEVVVLHSGLSDADRLAGWRRLRDGSARIALGARSAVFAPVVDLGIVVVDEEHDPSFKQEEGVRYHARGRGAGAGEPRRRSVRPRLGDPVARELPERAQRPLPSSRASGARPLPPAARGGARRICGRGSPTPRRS